MQVRIGYEKFPCQGKGDGGKLGKLEDHGI